MSAESRRLVLRTAPSGLFYHPVVDFSGSVRVELPMGRRAGTDYGVSSIDADAQTVVVDIPFEDMRHLVLACLRSRMMLHLEEADDDALEKFFFPMAGTVQAEEPEICGQNAYPGFANPPCPLDEGHDGGCTTI